MLLLLAAFIASGLVAWALATGSSEAQSGTMHNCPAAGKWSIAVWDGASGTAAADALATCGASAVDAAYALDPQTQMWWRWFAGKPETSNMPPFSDVQGVLALGSATGPVATPTPTATTTPTLTATPTPTTTPAASLSGGPVLMAQDGEYLGVVTCDAYDTDGIFNKYGTYGSKYSSTSIWNKYGPYGGKYAIYSPFNKYSVSPPEIVDSDGFVAYLSVNEYLYPVIDPSDLVYYCFQNDSYRLEYWLELVVDNTS